MIILLYLQINKTSRHKEERQFAHLDKNKPNTAIESVQYNVSINTITGLKKIQKIPIIFIIQFDKFQIELRDFLVS